MEKLTHVTGTAVPLDISDVDTDQIIPASWMKRIARTGYEDGLFQNWRGDPGFILNQPERRGATILISGPNFGCGSSREHAPWALRDYGFRVVISPSFADIFRNNLPNVGLVPVILAGIHTRTLLDATAADASASITIDLESQRVTCRAADVNAPFEIDPTARYQLINRQDAIDLTLEIGHEIHRYETTRSSWMPRANGEIETPFEDSGAFTG